MLAVLAVAICTMLCTGCAQATKQTRLRTPLEVMHGLVFGGDLSSSEYIGSGHARDWAMAEHAESPANQQRVANR